MELHKLMMRTIILIFLLFIFRFTSAQNNLAEEQWMEWILELLLENQSIESDRSDLELSIKEWLKHPINLNKASKEDLESFYFLSPIQAQNIIEHRILYGEFISLYELQAVKSIDLKDALLLSQFCYINQNPQASTLPISKKFSQGDHEIIIQQKRDFKMLEKESDQYAGDLNYISLRYRFQFKTNWYMGFGLEKDPGEKWNSFGDFQTFHFLYRGAKILKTIAIGDYHINLGSGLGVGSSHFAGKSSLVFQTQIFQGGVRPSRSLSELGYLRGLALSFGKRNHVLDLWASASPISANVIIDSLGLEDRLSGILLSGLHRTPLELSKRNQALQQIYGVHYKINFRNSSLGVLVQKSEKVSTTNFGSNQNWQRLLNLNQNTHSSIYGNLQLKNFQIQVEFVAQNWQPGAFLIKGILPLHSKLDWLILYRNYNSNYDNLGANGWSAQSKLANEIGMYQALVFKPKKAHSFSLYTDSYKTKSASFQKFKPAGATDIFVSYQYQPSKLLQLEIRFRTQISEKDNSSSLGDRIIEMNEQYKQQWRMQVNYQLHSDWKYQLRIEWVEATSSLKKFENGYLIYKDVNYQPKDKKWRLRGRYCFYNVSNYVARLYTPESDLPLSYSNRMLHKNGYYFYILSNYRINKHIDFHIKYAQHRFSDEILVQTEDYGRNQIREHQFKCQIRFKF